MKNRIPYIFKTCEAGVNSSYEPELVPDNQLAWMKNGTVRGGKASTRPAFVQALTLPSGNLQGISYCSFQGGMLVASIGGRIYRIRINGRDFAYDEITLDFINNPILNEAWMQETVGSLVIQDGQSNPIIYDGSSARRADPTGQTRDDGQAEVPIGKSMAYGNGRLWVAIGTNEVVAGDIKISDAQSELKFTETLYLSGGGAFYFGDRITGLGFVPSTGSSYGSLAVFMRNSVEAIRADVSFREQWSYMPGFIQTILTNTGCVSSGSIVSVNQDLFWRDSFGGLRSLRSAYRDEQGYGNSAISQEVRRITDYESLNRLSLSSSILFGNRLLFTASPYVNSYGSTSFRDLVSLDFATLATMSGKAAPAYDGEWEGLNATRLVTGVFNGKRRAFVTTLDDDGSNRLWEITEQDITDKYYTCTGSAQELQTSPIPMTIEYPKRDFGQPMSRKALDRCDVYLSNLEGNAGLAIYFRMDNTTQWTKWDEVAFNASMTDPSTTTPHTWLNIAKQDRNKVMTFSPPEEVDTISERHTNVGFLAQVRIVLTGKAKIDKVVCYARYLVDEQFADRPESVTQVYGE